MAEIKLRRPRASVLPFAQSIRDELVGIEAPWYFGGSWRRMSPMVGDLDVIVVGPIRDLPLSRARWEIVGDDIMRGEYVLDDGDSIHLDVWSVKPEQLGAFLWFVTGPKALNVAMRSYAKSKGLTLSQYGVLDAQGDQLDDGTEAGVALAVGWPNVTPERRDEWESFTPAPAGARLVVSSDGTKTYHVTKSTCTCPGFTYRGKCRHLDG